MNGRDMKSRRTFGSDRGFTLIELIVVVAIMGMLMAMAVPSFIQWRRGIVYRDSARGITSYLRNAKNDAIMNNRQQRVEFDLANRRYGIRSGTRANNTDWSVVPAITIWEIMPPETALATVASTEGTVAFVVFNPNGTALASPAADGTSTFTVADDLGAPQFDVTVTTSGRIAVARR